MTRPIKQGLDYFPLDVNCDDTLKMIEAKLGLTSFAVIVRLWQIIYDNGYFIKWTERELLLYKNRINADINLINDVINESIKWGLFDEGVYKKFNVLTSRGIQKRFVEAIKRRKEITVELAYWLIEVPAENDGFKVNYSSNEVNDDSNSKKDDSSTQSKERVKEIEIESNITPYAKIVDLWNSTVKLLPKVSRTTDARKKSIKARYEEGGYELFETVFRKVNESDFLCGKKDSKWSCGFDWVINPTNWTKIIEGNYDNKQQSLNLPTAPEKKPFTYESRIEL